MSSLKAFSGALIIAMAAGTVAHFIGTNSDMTFTIAFCVTYSSIELGIHKRGGL